MDTNPCYLLLDPVKLMVSLEIVCNRHQHHQIYIYIYTFIFILYYNIFLYIYDTYTVVRETNALSASAASRCYVVLKCTKSWRFARDFDSLCVCRSRTGMKGWTTRMNRGHWHWVTLMNSDVSISGLPVCSPEAIHHVSLSAPVQRDMIKHD